MTMETSDGNEVFEVSKADPEGECVLVSMEREDQPKVDDGDGIACGEDKEASELPKDDVDGSYVFVNDDSDDSIVRDLDMDVKSDSSVDQRAATVLETENSSERDFDEEFELQTEIDGISEATAGEEAEVASSGDKESSDSKDEGKKFVLREVEEENGQKFGKSEGIPENEDEGECKTTDAEHLEILENEANNVNEEQSTYINTKEGQDQADDQSLNSISSDVKEEKMQESAGSSTEGVKEAAASSSDDQLLESTDGSSILSPEDEKEAAASSSNDQLPESTDGSAALSPEGEKEAAASSSDGQLPESTDGSAALSPEDEKGAAASSSDDQLPESTDGSAALSPEDEKEAVVSSSDDQLPDSTGGSAALSPEDGKEAAASSSDDQLPDSSSGSAALSLEDEREASASFSGDQLPVSTDGSAGLPPEDEKEAAASSSGDQLPESTVRSAASSPEDEKEVMLSSSDEQPPESSDGADSFPRKEKEQDAPPSFLAIDIPMTERSDDLIASTTDKSEATQDQIEEQRDIITSEIHVVALEKSETVDEKIIGEEPSDLNDIATKHEEIAASGTDIKKPGEVKEQQLFIVRLPRISDKQLKTRMEQAQRELEENTKNRDSIRVKVQDQKAVCTEYWKKVEDARREERACKDAVTSKRKEIDSIQSMLSKLKNAHSITDIDKRVNDLQRRISHETNTLKEEKMLMREINQLKQTREHLSSCLAADEELQEAYDNQEQMETHIQGLKEELDSLRKRVQQAEGESKAARNSYEKQHETLRDLQAKYKAADDLRQESYINLRDLKKESYLKNQHFYSYKDDLKALACFNAAGDRHGLHAYCSRQVEKIMDMWNNDDEFREKYVDANTYSVVRRFKTIDGRSLGLDEEPVVIPAVLDFRERKTEEVVLPRRPMTPVLTPQPKAAVKPRRDDAEEAEAERKKKREEELRREEAIELTRREEELRREKEAMELTRREVERRREKEAAEERERLRVEQIAKAKEAEERKRRKAEKAQARAELKAQKEAVEREKKKKARQEKKMRKTTNAGSVDPQEEEKEEAGEEVEKSTQEGPPRKKPIKPTKPTKESMKPKPLPLPLRNRGKRKLLQTWLWAILAGAAILALFFAGNHFSLSNLTR